MSRVFLASQHCEADGIDHQYVWITDGRFFWLRIHGNSDAGISDMPIIENRNRMAFFDTTRSSHGKFFIYRV